MAERRMFHSAVVESDAFLDMPAGAQALYFHLGMHADDDGFVNGPRQIARKLRRPPRELKLLTECGFLLDFDGIMLIRHWMVGNSLRLDRMKPVNYPHLAEKVFVTGNREYTPVFQEGFENLLEMRERKLATKCQPKVREGKVKEGKVTEDKISEDKLREDNTAVAVVPAGAGTAAAADRDNSLKFLEGKLGKGVVLLSQQQIEDLLEKMGLDSFDYYVERMADFILNKQAKVKNHYATILKWWEEDRSVLQ
jgi:hypothetical protein